MELRKSSGRWEKKKWFGLVRLMVKRYWFSIVLVLRVVSLTSILGNKLVWLDRA